MTYWLVVVAGAYVTGAGALCTFIGIAGVLGLIDGFAMNAHRVMPMRMAEIAILAIASLSIGIGLLLFGHDMLVAD